MGKIHYYHKKLQNVDKTFCNEEIICGTLITASKKHITCEKCIDILNKLVTKIKNEKP